MGELSPESGLHLGLRHRWPRDTAGKVLARSGVGAFKGPHGERWAMPRIDSPDVEGMEPSHTCGGRLEIVHEGIETWPFGVLKQVATKQVAIGGEESDRAKGMTRKVNDLGMKSEGGKIKPVLEGDVWSEALGLAKGIQEGEQCSYEKVRFLSTHEHITTLSHAEIIRMHRDLGVKNRADVGGVPDMIEVAMCQNHKVERIPSAPGALKAFDKLPSCV